MELKGLRDLQESLSNLEKRANAVDGTHEVDFATLFPRDFMLAHTTYGSMQELLDAGGIEDGSELDGEAWNQFVTSNTSFSSWEDMKSTAASEWVAQQLGL